MSPSPSSDAFRARADLFLARFERAIDRVADDLDIDIVRSGNVVTLAFDSDHRIIVNSQEAAEEIWVAARSGGFHFRWDEAEGRWLDTRSGDPLTTTMARLIDAETGVAPVLDL